jgi:hypothetical protein
MVGGDSLLLWLLIWTCSRGCGNCRDLLGWIFGWKLVLIVSFMGDKNDGCVGDSNSDSVKVRAFDNGDEKEVVMTRLVS